jgi:hypothetical protein
MSLFRLGALLFILWLIWLLAGCTTTPEVKPPVLVPEKETVNIPHSLLTDCKPLAKLEPRAYTDAEMRSVVSNWVGTHDDCMNQSHKLAVIIKKAFNIDPAKGNSTAITVDKQPSK